MFDRFVRFAQAKKALRDGQFEAVLGLLEDPSVREHRRAVEMRDRALAGLMDRADRRAEAGTLAVALDDVRRVLDAAPEFEGARSLLESLEQRRSRSEDDAAAGKARIRQARQAIERGELDEARALLRDLPDDDVERRRLDTLIEARAASAARSVELARAALERHDTAAAVTALRAAREQYTGLDALGRLSRDVTKAMAKELAGRLQAMLDRGDAQAAVQEFERCSAVLPELAQDERLRKLVARATSDTAIAVRNAIEGGEFERAMERLARCEPREREAVMATVGMSWDAFERAVASLRVGDFASMAEVLRGTESHTVNLKNVLRRLDDDASRAAAASDRARSLAADGDLTAARGELVELLESCPMHEAARQELALLDGGARDKERRLARARELANEGKLREASELALALAVAGAPGDEARLILRDVQARIDVVQRGLQQVRRDAHGRSSGSPDGLQHCIARLHELQRVQSDAPEIEELAAALRAEIAGVACLERAEQAAAAGDVDGLAAALSEYGKGRADMLDEHRLDARFLELVDRIVADVERAVAGSRLSSASKLLDAVRLHAADLPAAAAIDGLDTTIRERIAVAEGVVVEADAALEARDVDEADRCLSRAREIWIDGASVRRLEAKLAAIRDREQRLSGVEALAEGADLGAAHRGLSEMATTDGLFRTRIFDIKQSLARAQGLDGAFLLRVDEGGEYLVMRGDTVSIGNMRAGGADLPILANLAGRHARVRRSMSFHGGMQDRIEADQGEVFVNEKSEPRVTLRDGMDVRLGRNFVLGYTVPSKRSLTSMLTLRGFTVAGTDKVLLMKDRGRDGRIVIGRGRDAHVRVPDATSEVEIFASKDGQIRVRSAAGGTIDRRPFSGDEPVPAGSVVECGGVTFVLQPWRRD